MLDLFRCLTATVRAWIFAELCSIDHEARRLVWSASGDHLSHHNASAQVCGDAGGRTRIVWIADLLPDSLAEAIAQMMDEVSGRQRVYAARASHIPRFFQFATEDELISQENVGAFALYASENNILKMCESASHYQMFLHPGMWDDAGRS